jgi:hypothetical protein
MAASVKLSLLSLASIVSLGLLGKQGLLRLPLSQFTMCRGISQRVQVKRSSRRALEG